MDLTTAQTMLDAWLAAELAILEGAQSYQIGPRMLTRVNMTYIRDNVAYWQRQVDALTDGRSPGPRARAVIPRMDL